MNCSLCGLPKDTGAMASVLPQCICHWKHTPYNNMEVKELNAGGEPVKNATYWKRQHDNLLMKLNICAIKVSELEKQLDIRTRELIGASFYEHDYKTMMANNKPVAWMLVDEINGDYMLERHPSGDYDWTPLYTHPVKELTLTKEEIHAVWASGQYYTLDKDGSIDEFHFADFAKAILRKAQEK